VNRIVPIQTAVRSPAITTAAIALAAVFAFVKGYEEPTLTRTYGEQYLDYRRNVPGWWPRLTPWRASRVTNH
jgi:protein-S-isoprenylcysteine O-methyltransferase Ste14